MAANARAGAKPEFLQDDGYETGVAVNGLQPNQAPGTVATSQLASQAAAAAAASAKQTGQRRGRAPNSK